jgi:hypothetical protein
VSREGRGFLRAGDRLDFELDHPEWQCVRKDPLQQIQRDIVDWNSTERLGLQRAMVGVPVKDGVHRISSERLFQAAAPEERIDLLRLAFDGSFDR